MRIGLDLSVIQTPHRMRGVGAVAINFVKNLSDEQKKEHTFVLFLYKKNQEKALSILDLHGLKYEVQTLKTISKTKLKLPGKLKHINGLINAVRDRTSIRQGDPRITDLTMVDSFLQFEQTRPLPRDNRVKKALILYDLIPYVLESDYLWTYRTARRNQLKRRAAFKKALERHQYAFKNKRIPKQADRLIAISEHTKKDFVRYMGLDESKIDVVHLGVDAPSKQTELKRPSFNQYVRNSWGYSPRPVDLTDKPFLLFVGGVDPRRKLVDLVAAFNNLKAQGYDIRLVLVGDSMQGAETIPVIHTRKYICQSSYLNDISFLGFVTETEKDWLYNNALAFVFPSVYEGFGLPVLEAMNYGTHVITYDNSSIREVAGNIPQYAQGWEGIRSEVMKLFNENVSQKQSLYQAAAQNHLKQFSWQKTVDKIIQLLN